MLVGWMMEEGEMVREKVGVVMLGSGWWVVILWRS